MRSSQLSLDQYDSDKITNKYLEWYDPVLEPWLEKNIVLLELGVYTGGSLLLWRDYFPKGSIVGIDVNLNKEIKPTERICLFEGSQADLEFLSHVANETAPEGFDIIIDDASHTGELTKTSFWHLFDNHLKPGGLYVIEDWGTGYWDDWRDGKSLDLGTYSQEITILRSILCRIQAMLGLKTPMPCHSYGMVGLVKQLVDEQGAHDVTRRLQSGKSTRVSRFSSITVTPSIVFVRKSNSNLVIG